MAENVTKINSLPTVSTLASGDNVVLSSGKMISGGNLNKYLGSSQRATIANGQQTEGWVRIAVVPAQTSAAAGFLVICNPMLNKGEGCVMLALSLAAPNYAHGGGSVISTVSKYQPGVTKVRVVYPTTSSTSLPMYLEVYTKENKSSASVAALSIWQSESLGVELLTTYTAGSIPTNYAAKEFAL